MGMRMSKWEVRAKNQQRVIDTLRRQNRALKNDNAALRNANEKIKDPKTARNAGAYIQTRHIVKSWEELWDYVNGEIHKLKESDCALNYVDDQITLANYKHIRDEMRRIKRAKAEECASE